MNKFFNCRKYCFDKSIGRWERTVLPQLSLSHDMWNYYNPENLILKNEVIHHKNGDSSDDRIENLQKMKDSEHKKKHMTGNQYSLGKQNTLDKHWSLSGETKQKMSDAKMCHIVTEKTKQKLRDANIGTKNPNYKDGKWVNK